MGIPRKGSLAQHIVTILVVKLVLIVSLWMAFFDEPQDEDLTREALQIWMLGQSADKREFVDGQ